MNRAPGSADPTNPLVPFGGFERLHYARFFIVDDQSVEDRALYGLPPPLHALYLAFQGEIDGDLPSFEAELAAKASAGLRTIFGHCTDFGPGTNLLRWMRSHEMKSAVAYVNAPGRTVREGTEEAALFDAVRRYVSERDLTQRSPRELHAELREFVAAEKAAGRLVLTPRAPTPWVWQIANLVDLIGVPVLLLVAFIPLLVPALVVFVLIRILESRDPEWCPRVSLSRLAELSAGEDRDVTNQFSAIGSLKPGLVRSVTANVVLWLVNYTTRHIYTSGRLARVQTIHFAHWIMIEGGERLLFISNYDGSLPSYNDDFINKVAFGLNAVFSNGIGYPKTTALVLGGAKDEQKFENFLRRHQLVTDVWYNAHPGLTAVDLWRHQRLRFFLESPQIAEPDVPEWLSLL